MGEAALKCKERFERNRDVIPGGRLAVIQQLSLIIECRALPIGTVDKKRRRNQNRRHTPDPPGHRDQFDLRKHHQASYVGHPLPLARPLRWRPGPQTGTAGCLRVVHDAFLRLAFRLIRANHLDHVKVSRLLHRLQRLISGSLAAPAAQQIRQPQGLLPDGSGATSAPKRQTNWTIVESDIGLLCAWQFQAQVALDLFAPFVHHLRLLREVRPPCHSGKNFLDDGFGPAAFH
jgi:hypothetical protein